MTATLSLRAAPLAPAQTAAMRESLIAAHLPADDLEADGVALFTFDRGGEVFGYGGFEAYGDSALIRSIVVAPAHRRRGLGRQIVESVIAEAEKTGVRSVFLLTTDAQAYFERLGFAVIARADAPASILATRQATGLCPSVAALMVRARSR